MFYMYVGLYFIYCFPVEGCSLAAESSILINYLVRERLYSFHYHILYHIRLLQLCLHAVVIDTIYKEEI